MLQTKLLAALEPNPEPNHHPPWPIPKDYGRVISNAWGNLVIARMTLWRDSIATQELESAMTDFRAVVKKLEASNAWRRIPWRFNPNYRIFIYKFKALDRCQKRYLKTHETDRLAWTSSCLQFGYYFDKAAPSQWNLRAELAAQSTMCRSLWPPLQQGGKFIIFDLDLDMDIQGSFSPSQSVTVMRYRSSQSRGHEDDEWIVTDVQDELPPPFFDDDSPPPPYQLHHDSEQVGVVGPRAIAIVAFPLCFFYIVILLPSWLLLFVFRFLIVLAVALGIQNIS